MCNYTTDGLQPTQIQSQILKWTTVIEGMLHNVGTSLVFDVQPSVQGNVFVICVYECSC
jgi:hypothetical protein